MGTTLVTNVGSSSRKYALYCQGELTLEIRFESTTAGHEMCSKISGGQQVCEAIDREVFSNSFAKVAEDVDRYLFRESAGRLDTVVIRVVAPGTDFQKHAVIDDEYIKALKAKENSAPLHITPTLQEISAAQKYCKQARLIAVSDSAFHSSMPSKAREYSIARSDSQIHDIHRFGYHGLSVSSVVRRIHSLIGIDPERMIVAHIGSGSSVTAVKDGKSVETTMGFSPTSGLPMGTRAGDIESGALLELMRHRHWLPRDVEVYLNTNGGLMGMSGDSDIRKLLDRRAQNDELAIRALDKFVYSIQKAIASDTVALGGLDVLVFTATAAVRSNELRMLILDGLQHLGVEVSAERNNVLIGKDGVVSVRNSPVKVVVMRTDEMGEMALVAQELRINNLKCS